MEFITKDITAAMLDQDPVDTQMGRANLVEYNTTEDTIVWLDRKGTTIQMVPPAPRGAPGEAIGDSDRDAVPFRLLSYPLTEHVSVDAVRGKRRFGTVNEMETFQEKVNEKLAIGNARYDLTDEVQRVNMLRGKQVDESGNVLRDFFDVFGLTPQTFNFALDTGSTEIMAKVRQGVRLIQNELNGRMARGFICYVGSTAFDMLVTHKTYKESKLATPQAADLLTSVNQVKVGPVVFEEYTFRPNGQPMVGEYEMLLFPVGVQSMLLGRYGPATWEIDQPAPRYAKQIADPKGTGVTIEMEAHSIHINTLPRCVVHGDARANTP